MSERPDRLTCHGRHPKRPGQECGRLLGWGPYDWLRTRAEPDRGIPGPGWLWLRCDRCGACSLFRPAGADGAQVVA